MEANLSRIHHMAKSTIEEYYRIADRLGNMDLSFQFQVFEKTVEADFDAFRSQLAKRKEEYHGLTKRMRKLLAYADYLKILLAGANEDYGISARLTRLASLGREITQLQNFIAEVGSSHSQGINPVQPVDFYKSAFTDQSRIFNLTVFLFDEKDLEAMRTELHRLLTKRQTLNDEIATLNQDNKLQIMSFDEFVKADNTEITV